MKTLIFLCLIAAPLISLGQRKLEGTLLVSPKNAYLLPNKFFKNDSLGVICHLLCDTLYQLPITGHRVNSIIGFSDSIQIRYIYNNADSIIFDDFLYYHPGFIIVDSNFYLDITTGVKEEVVFIKGKPIRIRSKFLSNLVEEGLIWNTPKPK